MNPSKPKTRPKRFKRIKYFKRKNLNLPRIKPVILRKSKRVVQGMNNLISIGPRKCKGVIDYKNVALLKKYVTPEGRIIPKRITHINAKQQRYITRAIKNARIVGLLPFVRVAQSNHNPEKSLYYY